MSLRTTPTLTDAEDPCRFSKFESVTVVPPMQALPANVAEPLPYIKTPLALLLLRSKILKDGSVYGVDFLIVSCPVASTSKLLAANEADPS